MSLIDRPERPRSTSPVRPRRRSTSSSLPLRDPVSPRPSPRRSSSRSRMITLASSSSLDRPRSCAATDVAEASPRRAASTTTLIYFITPYRSYSEERRARISSPIPAKDAPIWKSSSSPRGNGPARVHALRQIEDTRVRRCVQRIPPSGAVAITRRSRRRPRQRHCRRRSLRRWNSFPYGP